MHSNAKDHGTQLICRRFKVNPVSDSLLPSKVFICYRPLVLFTTVDALAPGRHRSICCANADISSPGSKPQLT